MGYAGHIKDGVVVFDAPTPLAEGTPVQVEATVNGTAAQPADATELPPHVAELLANPPPGLSPRALELIRLSWIENPEGATVAERIPSLMQPCLDLPEDAAQQVDHYLYGTPKR